MILQFHNFSGYRTKFNGLLFLAIAIFFVSCSKEEEPSGPNEEGMGLENPTENPSGEEKTDPDTNQDGSLNILLLGSSQSIKSGVAAFSLAPVAEQLQAILSQDATVAIPVNVEYQDTYTSKNITVALGSNSSNLYDYEHYAHSLLQYYYWPEGQQERMDNLKGAAGKDWDLVIVVGDPYIVSKIPGIYALGVNKIATKVAEGNARTLLMMPWPKDEQKTGPLTDFEEFTYRIADGAQIDLRVIPAGLVWNDLPQDLKEDQAMHPTPNGAYLAAASIYAHMYDKNASSSGYTYDDRLADAAFQGVGDAATKSHFSGVFNFSSPFQGAAINAPILRYNHTGTSSENGIIGGLGWVIAKDDQMQLERDGAATVHFNMGRANTNFEANKRYKIDASKFDYSIGFPMQDGGTTGDNSMLYGIDKRGAESENGTDLGAALYMVRENELPTGRVIPIRALYAQMKELGIATSAYRDNWHMSRDLDKASGGFIYTLLTGSCSLGEEPADTSSSEWRTWRSHKVGYETAWTLRSLEGRVPECD